MVRRLSIIPMNFMILCIFYGNKIRAVLDTEPSINLSVVYETVVVGLCYTQGKVRRLCLGERQLRGRMGKLLYLR